MLMLTDIAFTNALIKSVNFFLGCTLGLFYIFQGRKTNSKLLFYYGINVIGFNGLGLGVFIDFITVLITGHNMDGQLKFYLVWGPAVITNIFFVYVFAEILIPKKKWYFLSLILILNTLYLLDLFIIHWTPHIIIYPVTPGEALVQVHFALYQFGQIFPWRFMAFSASYIVFIGVGLLYKAFGIKGMIRKKYIYLSTGMIVLGIDMIYGYTYLEDAFGYTGAIIRAIIQLTITIFAYLGLRAEPEQRKKKVKKKLITKDSLFRIVERPEQITEEEVTYYREQKICLVCKGKVEGFNIFLCPNCEALYHE
ncbi:MAG: hypothetical protein ACFE9N_07765, partial [Promethearchaeota archaeon]